MTKEDIKNWKLVEVISNIEIVADDSTVYFENLVEKLNIPLTNHIQTNRENTQIDWSKLTEYHRFFLDGEGEEEKNTAAFRSSELSQKKNLIFIYGYKEPAVLIPTSIFINDWEDFIASTQWETIIFSEDLELIMEVSRDYNLHSNFKII
ncbi:hypothetical protein [uncultured Croceitalea sp.]|uniref:hypothetical protein n=1 Tax=uncultured Croceitalea sp. TaxID=1798908 RepID=UPI0033058136